jgi:hypothetical protein
LTIAKLVQHESQEILDHAGIQPVADELTVPLIKDQTGMLEHLEVEGERTGTDPQPLGELPGIRGSLPEPAEDSSARRIGQGLEGFVVAKHLLF